MRYGFCTLALLAVTVLVAPAALASVPDFVTYSGRLTDGTAWGQSTTLDLTFRVYGSADGDDLLWQKEYPGLAVEDGYFSVLLGDGDNPDTPEVETDYNVTGIFAANDETWITVCIGEFPCVSTFDLSPRQQIGSVPYAIRSTNALSLGWQTESSAPVVTVEGGNVGIGTVGAKESLVVDGTVKATKFAGDGVIPAGGIILWSGSIASIPEGWALCDGTNGTPDLTNRFVVHADADVGGENNVGDTGGSHTMSHTHSVDLPNYTGSSGSHVLSNAQIPSHGHSASCSIAGNHSHHYTIAMDLNSHGESGNPLDFWSATNEASTSSAGNHAHSISIGSTGGGQSHNHTVNHNHGAAVSGPASNVDNRPQYYALAYIMKL